MLEDHAQEAKCTVLIKFQGQTGKTSLSCRKKTDGIWNYLFMVAVLSVEIRRLHVRNVKFERLGHFNAFWLNEFFGVCS